MKTQKVKTKKVLPSKRATIAKGFDPDADVIAKSYMKDKASLKEIDAHVEKLREEVTELVATKGVRDGNTLLCKGNNFVVGISDVMTSPTLAEDALRQELQKNYPKLLAKIFVPTTVHVLDEAELIKSVEEGHLPRNVLETYTNPSVKKGERLLVSKI